MSEESSANQIDDEEDSVENKEDDINFESETFDANVVLLTDENLIKLPVPSAKLFNNLDEYVSRTIVKSPRKPSSTKSSNESSTTIKRNLELIPSTSTRTRVRRELPTVITKMKDSYGPISILYKSLNNRIKILIRRRKNSAIISGRFGWLNGLLVAFDKHYNLILADVYENYKKIDQKTKEQIDVNNYVKQLFIRGDNVILLSIK